MFRVILKRIQFKIHVHQKDLFLRHEKHFQDEIAIRSRDIAINKKVPLECSYDSPTRHCVVRPERKLIYDYGKRPLKANCKANFDVCFLFYSGGI